MPSVVQSDFTASATFGASPRAVTAPFTATTGNTLFVIVSGAQYTGTQSLTDDQSHTWVQEHSGTNYAIFRCASVGATAPSTFNAVWTGGSSSIIEMEVVEVSGLDGNARDSIVTGAGSWGTSKTLSVTTTAADDFIFGVGFGQLNRIGDAGVGGVTLLTAGNDTYRHIYAGAQTGAPTTADVGFTVTAGYNLDNNVALVYSADAGGSSATLSSPTSASVTSSGATVGATTDDATGTLYAVATTSATAPSATQIKAGQDHTGSAASASGSDNSLIVGANTIALTGLSASTQYYYYLVQDNGADSNVVNGTFTTLVNAPVISSFTILNEDADGFDIRFTTDTGNGTAYYVVYPTSASDPTATQIVAGTDGDSGAALASGNMSVSATGQQTFPSVNGLSSGVTYRVAVVHYGVPA